MKKKTNKGLKDDNTLKHDVKFRWIENYRLMIKNQEINSVFELMINIIVIVSGKL